MIKYENSKKSEKKRLILKYVLENGEMPLSVLRNSINSADYAIKTLREEKALEVYDKKVLAEPYINSLNEESSVVELNDCLLYTSRCV